MNRFVIGPSTALYSLCGSDLSLVSCSLCCPQSPLRPLSSLWPSVPSTALCPFYCLLSSLRPSVSSTAICPLFITMYPLRSSSPSTILCALYNILSPLYDPLSHLRPYVLTTPLFPSQPFISFKAICLLYGPLPPLEALCPLYGPLPPILLSVPSVAFCPFFNPMSFLQPSSHLLPDVPLYGPLFLYGALLPLRHFAPSTTLCTVYTVQPSILSTSLCFLYSPLSSLSPSVSSTALSPLRPSVLSMALCLLYSPLSPFIPSTALCPLYGLLCLIQTSIVSMDLCSLYGSTCRSSLLCPPFVFPFISYCFSFPLSPPLVSSPLCFLTYISHIWFLSLYLSPLSLPFCLFFSLFLLLSLPSVTPSVFSL
jgi:hypothetical protein